MKSCLSSLLRTALPLLAFLSVSSVAGISRAATVSGGARGVAYAHSPTSFTDPNAVGAPVPGVQVTMNYCKGWTLVRTVQALVWSCNSFGSKSATTDANGAYVISVTDAVNPPANSGKTVASFSASAAAGDEYMPPSPIASFGGGVVGGKDYKRVALLRSPNSAMWLRRYGTGDYPFFFVEGFDPQNSTKTGDEAVVGNDSSALPSKSILRIMRRNPLGGAPVPPPAGANNNMLDFLVANNYSVYIIASGNNWRNPQAGVLADHSDGMAYQAMALIKQARERFHPTLPIVLGGYSLGGSLARTGLLHWCKGDFAGIAGSQLAAGCSEVGLWWAADAPLDTATVPESIIRLMKDGALNAGTTRPYKESMNSGAARELLETWTTDGCTTSCADEDGCVSAIPSQFENGCTVDNSVRANFQAWNGMPAGRTNTGTNAQLAASMPTRWGTPLPAVTFSLGREPRFGSLPERTLPSPQKLNGQTHYMQVHTHGTGSLFGFQVGSIDAYVNLYAKDREMVVGSRLNSLGQIQTVSNSSDSTGWGLWTTQSNTSNPVFDFYPTFIPSRSALLWSAAEPGAPTFWKDWRTNSTDADHFKEFPALETGLVLAWASEYSKGQRSLPVKTSVKTPNDAVSRAPSKEIVNGRDDDGDEQVDEMQVWDGPGLTAAWTSFDNRYLTFVNQNRYWKYDNLEDWFMPQTGYFGEGRFVPDVPWGNASVWFDAPLVNGQKPWDGLGITAAYTAPATGDALGPAQFIVLFSRDKYWVYRAGADGAQSWIASGWVGDGRWLPNILPYFEASWTPPSVNGWKPWHLSGVTGIHYDEWARTDTLVLMSEDRMWYYHFADSSWEAIPWLRGGIATATWTTYDRSVQCIAGNGACTWLDCGSPLYSDGGFTHVSCFSMGGGFTPRNAFDISAWGSQIATLRPSIMSASFSPASGSSCAAGLSATIASTCNGRQICNVPLAATCGGTVSYFCSAYNSGPPVQVVAGIGKTLALTCPQT